MNKNQENKKQIVCMEFDICCPFLCMTKNTLFNISFRNFLFMTCSLNFDTM